MQVQELRIGSAVMCECRGEYKPHIIKSIWYNDVEKLYFVELDNGFQCNVGGISPILITEEWITEHQEMLDIAFCGGFYLQYEKHFQGFLLCDTGDDLCVVSVKYIHELQNTVFVLTGKELEIKL